MCQFPVYPVCILRSAAFQARFAAAILPCCWLLKYTYRGYSLSVPSFCLVVNVCGCRCYSLVDNCCQLTADCGQTAAALNILGCLCNFFSYIWLVIFDKIKQSCNVLFQMLGQGSARGCSRSFGKFVDMPSFQIGQMVADFVQLNTVTFGYVHSFFFGYMVSWVSLVTQAFKMAWKRVKNSMKCRVAGVAYEKRQQLLPFIAGRNHEDLTVYLQIFFIQTYATQRPMHSGRRSSRIWGAAKRRYWSVPRTSAGRA